MKNARAWSLLTIDGARQYGGNTGYADDPSKVYRYDSDVANYKQVSEDDVIVLRSRSVILGVARIEDIVVGKGNKQRLRCPRCGITNIKQRTTMQPPWACKNRHTFDAPKIEAVAVDTFAVHYGSSFRGAPSDLTMARLNEAVMRPSDQMSIKEIDLAKIEKWLKTDPACGQLVFDYASAIDADAIQQLEEDDAMQSVIETRSRVLREINLRRGQRQFRERLISRYGAACQISRCDFPGLVEGAHIRPYAESNDNGVRNGILLRSDLHTLFDLGMLAIHPDDMVVKLHPVLLAAGYENLEDKTLFINGTKGPDHVALSERWDFFQKTVCGL